MRGVLKLPKGQPLTSTERMRLKKLRDQGLVEQLPNCKQCNAQLKVRSGSGKAYSLGLCYACWRKTSDYRIQKRENALAKEFWAVGYFSGKPGEPLEKRTRLREAIGKAYVGRNAENGPVFVVWNDGRITEHYGLTATNSKGMSPDHWSACDLPPDNPEWFLDQIPQDKRTWFES